jgi:bifunctional non-homologous end joining protein LigD
VASALAQEEPDAFVDTAAKARRRGRIFIDHLRNTRGATSVASYSLRARPGAPVALPVAWEELGRLENAQPYDLRSALARLARRKRDPWEAIAALRQTLPRNS